MNINDLVNLEPKYDFRDFEKTPVENEKMSVCATMQKLYDTLVEIEYETNRLGTVMFGIPQSELCAGKPDCLEANAHMALDMANLIRQELDRITQGLLG